MKRILSFVIVMAMLLCMIPMAALTVSADTAGYVDLTDATKYPDGSTYTDTKTNTSYTVIRTKAKLIELVKADFTGNYILANDINMGGTTYNTGIFGNSTIFEGILDGNGFSIYNFTTVNTHAKNTVALLFQFLKGDATIKNLSIGKAGAENHIQYTVNYTSQYVGTLAGQIHADSTSTQTVSISNVDVYCDITYNKARTGETVVGGFFATSDTNSNACSVAISDCSFTGSISFSDAAQNSGANTYVGGIVGYHQYGSLNIQGTSNNADIDITNRTSGDKVAYVGGFIGRAHAAAALTNCYNMGDITSDKYSAGFIGGANFGGAETLSATLFDFESCVNYGNVTANNASSTSIAVAGGIMGYANFGTYVFENCGNTGDLFSSYKTGKVVMASGMLGRYWVNNSNTSMTDCYSTGKILSSQDSFTAFAFCNGAGSDSTIKITAKNCVWNNSDYSGIQGALSSDSGNNKALNIIAKETPDGIDANIQKSDDNTMLRVLLMTDDQTLDANTDVIIKVYYGNSGKKFTVGADQITALETVQAAGETYHSVDGQYIFGAVIKGIPEDVMPTITKVTVEYGDYSFDFNMSK